MAVFPSLRHLSSAARQLLPPSSALLLLFLLRQSGLTERLNLFAYDLALHFRPAPSGATTPVRIVGIDEQDLVRYGPQVPDALLAEAVHRLDQIGVQAIGLDMFCGQPVGTGWQRLQHLAATNPRLVSVFFDLDGRKSIPGTPSHRQASADLFTDPQDGVLRRDVLHVTAGAQAMQVSLPLRLLQVASSNAGLTPPFHAHSDFVAPLTIGAGGYLPHSGVAAPAYRQRMLAFYKPGSFPTISLRTLLRDPLPAPLVSQLHSSIVLIGVTAPSSKDFFAVPHSLWRTGQQRFQLAGVEVHAHRLAALLSLAADQHPGIQPVSSQANTLLLLLGLALGVVVGECVISLRRSFTLVLLGFVMGVLAAAVALALGFWADAALPMFAFVFLAGSSWARRGAWHQSQNNQARLLAGRFLSTNVAQALLNEAHAQPMSSQVLTVSVLISDLRGFSLLGVRYSSAHLVAMLNEYLPDMFEIIEAHGGTIDEVLGDAILAIFGAPQPRLDHADAAIACALRMHCAMEQVNHRNRAQGLPLLAMGIGICTGEVIAGPIGSERRAKYAVVGPAVNLASRIEALTVGGELLVADSTLAAASAPLQINSRYQFVLKDSPLPLAVSSVQSIGDPYHLSLPSSPTSICQKLAEPIAIHYQMLQQKVRTGGQRLALLTHVSEDSACLAMAESVPQSFDDLILSLPGCQDEVCAKVRGECPSGVRVVFTLTSDQSLAWFRSLPLQRHRGG